MPELATRLGELPSPTRYPPDRHCLRLYEAIGTFLKLSVHRVLVLTLDDSPGRSRKPDLVFWSYYATPNESQATSFVATMKARSNEALHSTQ